MADCFISYASADAAFAEAIKRDLEHHGLTVFLAAASLVPGQQWTESIWANLRSSRWVLFLASRAACSSAYVQQELGMAIRDSKVVVPLVWDMPPNDLPGWTKRYQALDLRGATVEQLAGQIATIAERIKASKRQAAFVLSAIVIGLFLFGGESK